MKDLEWCEMNDEMDFYLSRCIKNWAARYQPPASARQQLLRAAGSLPVTRQSRLERFLSDLRVWLSSPAEPPVYYADVGWIIRNPSAQSSAWTFHFVTSGTWPARTFLNA